MRGSKLRRYACRRPAGKPACPLDTTRVHGSEGDTTYPASAGAENPGGAALQALKDCKKAGTGPPNVRYRTSLTMTAFVFGSKLAWIPCSSTKGESNSQRRPRLTVRRSVTRHASCPYTPVSKPPALFLGPVTA